MACSHAGTTCAVCTVSGMGISTGLETLMGTIGGGAAWVTVAAGDAAAGAEALTAGDAAAGGDATVAGLDTVAAGEAGTAGDATAGAVALAAGAIGDETAGVDGEPLCASTGRGAVRNANSRIKRNLQTTLRNAINLNTDSKTGEILTRPRGVCNPLPPHRGDSFYLQRHA